MKYIKILKKICFYLFIGFTSIFIFSQDICDEFEVLNLEFEPDTEWGNLLQFEVEIPDTSIYAPYFYLSTEDNYIQVTDSILSFFWVTGPTTVNLLYHFEYNIIPENLVFSGVILMISGDDILNCEIPFEFLVNIPDILGDINEDSILNIEDILIFVDIILSYQFYENADLNMDGIINIIDILLLINFILMSD